MKHLLLLSTVILLLALPQAHADIAYEAVFYEHDGLKLQGYLAIPDGEVRGAVLVVHEWGGGE